ncbi:MULTISPECIES: hypothetical protein [unclassified Yoonia]|uniref:hypothetical protein n=1 Tax=unclassified Yoonia TaxID=2629118 RepID=UPI002AFE0570|nr:MULTISPECIES: hypothetical protein [unclassified Yoonia]
MNNKFQCDVDPDLPASEIRTTTFGRGEREQEQHIVVSPREISLRTGRNVDAIIFDGKRFGGGGGGPHDGYVMSGDDYISTIIARHGARLDAVRFETKSGLFVGGGGGGGKRSLLEDVNAYKFKVGVGRGGSSNSLRITSLTVEYVKPYYQSQLLHTAPAIFSLVSPRQMYQSVVSEEIRRLDAWKTILQRQQTIELKQSITAEIVKGVSATRSLTFTDQRTTTREIREEIEKTVKSSETNSIVQGDEYGFVVGNVDILCNPAEGVYFVPRGTPALITVKSDEYNRLAGYWSFVGGRAAETVTGLGSNVFHGVPLLEEV